MVKSRGRIRRSKQYISMTFFVVLVGITVFAVSTICVFVGGQSLDITFSHLLVPVTFCFFIIVWNITYGKAFADPINYLLISLLVFHSSESLLFLFGMKGFGVLSSLPASPYDYTRSNLIIVIGVLFLLIGAVVAKHKKKKIRFFSKNHISWNIAKPAVGTTLLAIGFIAFAFDMDPAWFTSAYREFGDQTLYRLIWSNTLPVAGFIFLLSNKRLLRYSGYAVLIILFVIYAAMGNRGYAFSILLTAFWLYNFKYRSVRLVTGLLFAFLIVVLVAVFYQLKPLTVQEKLNLSSYTFTFDELSPIISLLEEGSATYRSTLYTVQMIPEYKDYDYGGSYVWALSTIIPNIFGDIHPAKLRKNPSIWLTWCITPKAARQGRGYGFSIIAEGYYNFGIIGVVSVMLLVGWFISRLTLVADRSTTNTSTVVLAIILHNLLWGVRNAAESIVRPIVWEIMCLFTIYLLVQFVRQALKFDSKEQKGRLCLKT